jgi:hypothetical protein
MRAFIASIVVSLLSLSPLSAAASAPDEKKQTPLDLQPQANHKLKDDYGLGDEATLKGNNLASLPVGEQKLGGVKFKIGERMILLSGKSTQDMPKRAEGIAVGMKLHKLYVLQATHWQSGDDVVVGHLTVNYDDKSHETIPIVYGKNTFDWWNEDLRKPSPLKVAWKGENEVVKKQGRNIRLYLLAWENPHPMQKVVSIDVDSTNETDSAPFCVAMTVEE